MRSVKLLFFCVVFLGCGSSNSNQGEAICQEPEKDRLPNSTCVRSVKGQIVDEAGQPIKDNLVTVCGSTCYGPSRTTVAGEFSVPLGVHIPLDSYSVIVHGRPSRSSIFVTLPTTSSSDVIAVSKAIQMFTLPASVAKFPANKAPAQTVVAGDFTFSVPADNVFYESPEDDAAEGRSIRMLKIPQEKYPPFADGQNLAVLYALAPFELKSKLPLGVAMANPDASKFKAGAAVEFVVLGTAYDAKPPTAGRAVAEATGKVSADGSKIETDQGQGIFHITWLGVRPKS